MFAAPQTAPAAHAGGLGGLGEVTLALLLVLGAVFALAWVLKRVRTFGSRVGGALDVLAQLPLGQKERAVLIRSARRRFSSAWPRAASTRSTCCPSRST